MSNRKKVKAHLKEHKELYIGLGVGFTIAGITYFIMRGHTIPLRDAKPTYWAHQSVKSPLTGHIDFHFNKSRIDNSFNVVNVNERNGRGHPGYMTRCLEDNLTWMSQKEAANANNIHPNRLSDHLNGRLDHVDGKHFERIYMAA
jgi:hypothetical protein